MRANLSSNIAIVALRPCHHAKSVLIFRVIAHTENENKCMKMSCDSILQNSLPDVKIHDRPQVERIKSHMPSKLLLFDTSLHERMDVIIVRTSVAGDLGRDA